VVKRSLASLAVLAMLVSGCGASVEEQGVTDQGVIDSNLVKVGDDNYVYEFDTSDGTHCVIVEGYHRDVALSCDWVDSTP